MLPSLPVPNGHCASQPSVVKVLTQLDGVTVVDFPALHRRLVFRTWLSYLISFVTAPLNLVADTYLYWSEVM